MPCWFLPEPPVLGLAGGAEPESSAGPRAPWQVTTSEVWAWRKPCAHREGCWRAGPGLLSAGVCPPAAPPALEVSEKLLRSPLLLDRRPCHPETGPPDCSPASLLGGLAGSLRVVSAGGRQSVVRRFPWVPPSRLTVAQAAVGPPVMARPASVPSPCDCAPALSVVCVHLGSLMSPVILCLLF